MPARVTFERHPQRFVEQGSPRELGSQDALAVASSRAQDGQRRSTVLERLDQTTAVDYRTVVRNTTM
jgi:hypothetical protein